jgi:hypothetical protein
MTVLEILGIDPSTSHMLSEALPSELHPLSVIILFYRHVDFKKFKCQQFVIVFFKIVNLPH